MKSLFFCRFRASSLKPIYSHFERCLIASEVVFKNILKTSQESILKVNFHAS